MQFETLSRHSSDTTVRFAYRNYNKKDKPRSKAYRANTKQNKSSLKQKTQHATKKGMSEKTFKIPITAV